MTRVLLLISAASFVLCVACIAGSTALGWNRWHDHFRPWHWQFGPGRHVIWSGDGSGSDTAGVAASRDIAWNGGDALDIDVPGEVDFTQGPGPGKLTVTGPADLVNHVVLAGSHLELDDGGDQWGEVHVVMTAPAVTHFAISGSDTLNIAGFDQNELDLQVSGSGAVTAKGKAHAAQIDISGSGQVDFGGLAVDSATANISGFGRASIAPANSANLHISGAGEIDLLTHPAQLSSDVSGAGRIVENQPGPANATAPAS
jgi:hypothetical protein